MFFAIFLELYSNSRYNKGRGVFAILRYYLLPVFFKSKISKLVSKSLMIVIFFIVSCKFFSYFNTCPYNILPDPFINVIINNFFPNSLAFLIIFTCFDNDCIREFIFDLATTSRFMIKSTLMNLYHHFQK